MHVVSAFSTIIRSCLATLAVMAGILLLLGSTAHATTLASEDFNYTGALVNKNGGVGFGSAWTAVAGYSDPTHTTGSMPYTSGGITLVTSGNRLQPAFQSRATRNFSSAVATANQTMW